MAADYAALEARVSELERQLRHVLPSKIDAVSYGLSLVHEDTRSIRETQDNHGRVLADHGAMLDRQAATLADHGRMLADHGQMLAEILRRLPEPER